MNYKVIWVILIVFVTGVSFFVWNNRNNQCDPSYCDPLLYPDSLQLSANSGNVPLTVTVTGPKTLVANKNNTWNLWVQCSFNIDWGDEIMSNENANGADKLRNNRACAETLTHTYKTPGNFVVKAYTFHPDPVDAHITDWSGTTRVRVESRSAQTTTSTATQNVPFLEIELVVGGNFQGTSYHVKDSKLIYNHSDAKGEQNSTTVLTAADLTNINNLLARYNLDALQNDPPPPPDALFYYLTIIRGGKTYKLRLVSSKNPGYSLTLALGNFFAQANRRTSDDTPCGPTENCAHVIQATIKNSCAPWDGRAIDISMNYNGGVFNAQLFAKGFDLFETGKSVVIDDSSDSTNGTGLANFCPPDTGCLPYLGGQVKISNPSGVFKENQTTHLNIIINRTVIPVEAHWENSPQACG